MGFLRYSFYSYCYLIALVPFVLSLYDADVDNVCEKDRAGDTVYTEDIAHQCKNSKERGEEYIVHSNIQKK